MKLLCRRICGLFVLLMWSSQTLAQDPDELPDDQRLQAKDVFDLEYASDPQVSPDGRRVVYVRNFMDIMKDRRRSNLWLISTDGSQHRPITTGIQNDTSPRWSQDGTRLAYVSSSNGSTQIYCRWMDTGDQAKLSNLTNEPNSLVWSPDGRQLAFSMHVPSKAKPLVDLPAKPEGAEWAESPKVIDKLVYRYDGEAYLKDGYDQLFVLPSEGGTPRQLTAGPYDHSEPPSWTPDGESLIFSSNRNSDWEYEPRESEIYELLFSDRSIKTLTARRGPDFLPAVSPDGKQIAFLGFDDRQQGYQITQLYVMNRDGSQPRPISKGLDRSVGDLAWRNDGKGVFIQYDDQGDTKISLILLTGKVVPMANNVGGTTIGRPYSSGSFSVAHDGTLAFTKTHPSYPADVAVGGTQSERRITSLCDDILAHKELARVETAWFESSADKRKIQGWIVKPPDFEAGKKYPLILEIHGGPFANYGERFSAEMQLYAAAGYVVLYVNPRGSTGYGEDFGNLIHHNYPGEDYDDLMSGVDSLLQRGYIDQDNLFVTGGSGGGVLSSWIVGKTDRFRAAVVAKPVINWYSFVLTADAYPFFYKYWFPGYPWDHADHYLQRSPISLVGNVTTPTMLLTGEADHRTPISESEQFYQALKLRKIDTVLVRIPNASHGITDRPSNLIAKVAHVLKWFEMHKTIH